MTSSAYPNPPVPTAYLIKMATGLSEALGLSPHASFSPAHSAAAATSRTMIDAVLLRDLDIALRAAGKAECEANGTEYKYGGAPYSLLANDSYRSDGGREAPKRHTYQAAWRDHYGWACKTERMATWVAGWIARHLDPRDSDGNPNKNDVREIEIGGKPAWLAVRGSVKVPD